MTRTERKALRILAPLLLRYFVYLLTLATATVGFLLLMADEPNGVYEWSAWKYLYTKLGAALCLYLSYRLYKIYE